MPLVQNAPRRQADGTIVTQFLDTTSTAAVTYTYPEAQTGLHVVNKGNADIFVTVGSYNDIKIIPNDKWKVDTNYTSFSIRSNVNSQEFLATARIVRATDVSSLANQLASVSSQVAERVKTVNNIAPDSNGNVIISSGGDQVVKSEVVQTTTGKSWSTTVTEANTTLDSVKHKVVTKTLSITKRIVLFGSSSTEGTGVSNPSNSFANRLSQRLTSRGYNVINRGVSGDNTSGAIARFFKDVVPLNPDFVIFGFTIGNEGIYSETNKAAVYDQFRNNMFKLIHMTKKFGAVPIVLTQAPTQSFTSEIYNYSKKLQEELDESGVLCVDWGGVVDDLSGQPFANAMSDAWHYNDVAHKEICNAIPPSLFEKAVIQKGGLLQTPNKGSIRYASTMSTQTPIHFIPSDEITTFTFFARFKKDIEDILCGLVSFNASDRVFLNDGFISYTSSVVSDVTIANSKNFANGEWFSLAITCSPLSPKIRFYVDGVFKVEGDFTINPTKISIGGRDGSALSFKNGNVKDVALYRTRLKDYQIAQLHDGLVSQTSLEIYSPMNDKTIFPNGKLVNLAGTTSNFIVNVGETGVSSSD